MSDPSDLAAFLDMSWQYLRRGVADARSPARYPAFATVSPDGIPEVRTVALRCADQGAAMVEVHTDIFTPKVSALRATPRAALQVWLPRPRLQIRLAAFVEILTGEAVEEAWARVPAASRLSYGTRPEPGTPIPDAFAYDKPPMRDRFAVLRCRVDHIDLVDLGPRHRRAAYTRETRWRGTWLSP